MNLKTARVYLDNVYKYFGSVKAVDGITLEIEAGKFYTLLGPSGCGKTTTLRIIAGLEEVTKGKVYIGDKDVTKLMANERDVTMVFQSYALFPHLTVYNNIAYGLKVKGYKEDEIRKMVKDILELMGLSGLENRSPKELSGGQQQRVALSRSLVLRPKVILFDEPLSNLDTKLRRRMRGEIKNIQKQFGITSIYVTHDQSEAMSISDVIVVMSKGKIQQIGNAETLYKRPANRFVADFIGEANLVHGKVSDISDGKIKVVIDGGEVELKMDKELSPGTEGFLVIRPEAIKITKDKTPIKAKVFSSFYIGQLTEYLLDTLWGEISAVDYSMEEGVFSAGEEVYIKIIDKDLYFIAE